MNALSPLRRVLCLGAAAALVALPIVAPQVARASDLTLAQTIAADPELSTLARALEAAGLGPTLGTAPAITLLAPTNAAFAALPAGTLEGLLQPDRKADLVALLQRHAIGATIDADALKKRRSVETLGGATLKTGLVNGKQRIEEARLAGRYRRTANGYLIPIDRVLTP
jgi:uncharacterized surface protein with fasciclin (FAS1) repeats